MKNGGLIDNASQIIGKAGANLIDTYYNATQNLVNNYLLNVVLVLIACFWVYNKIGKEWCKEDFYKAGSWVLMYVFIKAVFTNVNYFHGFLNVIQMPASWFYEAIGANNNSGKGVDSILEYSLKTITNIWESIDFVKSAYKSLLLMILGLFLLCAVWIYALFYAVFVVVIQFVSAMLLAFCPVMLPALLIPNFRGYFFSWLKLYTSTAIQPAFAYGIGSIIGTAIAGFGKNDFKINIDTLDDLANILFMLIDFFTIILLCIAAVSALSKIPAWTQQIIGSGDGEHKTGLAGVAKMGGAMVKRGFSAYSQARNAPNYAKSGAGSMGKNSFGRAAMSGLAAMIPGGAGLSQKIAGQNEMAKAGYENRIKSAGQFNAMGTPHIDNSKK